MRFSNAALLALGVVVFVSVAPAAGAGWEESFDALVAATDDGERASAMGEVLAQAPSWQEVARRLESAAFAAPEPTVPGFCWSRGTTTIPSRHHFLWSFTEALERPRSTTTP